MKKSISPILGTLLAAAAIPSFNIQAVPDMSVMPLLGSRGRVARFFGTSRVYRSSSKYMPHQGEQEIARRRKQVAGGKLNMAGADV